MEAFFASAFGFPTVIWTALLLFCLMFWGVSIIGLLDFDTPEMDPELPDGGLEGIAGLLSSLGLGGVPLSVALTSVSLCGWLISYFSALWLLGPGSGGWLSVLISILILLGSPLAALKPAAWLIRPLKPLFKSTKASSNDVLGKTATVVYTVSPDEGIVDCMVNGAHLRLEARSSTEMKPGEKAVVIRYHKQDSVYQVVPEADFMTGLTR